MAPSAGSPKPPTADAKVLAQHDELMRILDWQPAARGGRDPYWENEAATFGHFADGVLDALDAAMGDESIEVVEASSVTYRRSNHNHGATARQADATS